MNADRRIRLWSLIVARASGRPVTVEHVCAAAVGATGVDRASVTVVLPAALRETICASDALATDLEELTLTLGEGPGIDAVDAGPGLVADLTSAWSLARWPMFAPAAVDAGACAVFSLPLRVGAIRLGVLSLYRATPGDLDPEELADALVLADTACSLLLDAARSGPQHVNGHQPELAAAHHPEIHQATGMITVQLGVTAAVALARLRAFAFAHDRRLRDVALDVVARRLRFHPDPSEGRDGR